MPATVVPVPHQALFPMGIVNAKSLMVRSETRFSKSRFEKIESRRCDVKNQKRRISLSTGKPYPKCQRCRRTAYTDGLCWGHYIKPIPTERQVSTK